MIKSIIFDFDGTLVNTNDVIIEAWQHTYRHYGQDEKPVEHITKCFGEPLLVTMAREFPQVDPEESAQVYRDRQIAKAEELVTLFDDIPPLGSQRSGIQDRYSHVQDETVHPRISQTV